MMRTQNRHRLLIGFVIICLSACSSLQQSPPPATPLDANQQLQQWQLSGKIGVRDGKQGHTAYLNWRQCGPNYLIRLTGPLGQGAAQLSGNPYFASLTTSDQQTYTAASPELLLAQHVGWSLPVSQLFYWIRGIPAPEQPHQSAGPLTAFSQNGWQLSYPRLLTIDNYQLPGKAVAEQAPLKVTLVIKQWQLQPDCSND